MSDFRKEISRRNFLRNLIIISSGGVLSTITIPSWIRGAEAARTVDIRFTAPSSYDVGEKGWAVTKSEIGFKIKFADNGNDVGPVLARMINGTMARDFDVQGLQGGAELELARAGKILPWDMDKILKWESIWPWANTVNYNIVDGKRYGIPIAMNADSMIYLPEEIRKIVKNKNDIGDSYSLVFDDRLAGRTSMEDSAINSTLYAAMYLKGNGLNIKEPGNLTENELKEVMTFLIQKKKAGQFRRFWRGWEQGVQVMRSKEVVAMTGWEPIVKALQREGINAQYAKPREGYLGWTNSLLLHIGASDRKLVDEAHIFANWLLSGYYGCELLRLRGYVVPNDSTLDFARKSAKVDLSEIKSSIANVIGKISGGPVFWQNVRPIEYRLYEEWWDKVRNA